ncbi:hypothetical protein ACTHGU_07780 [Chitinophagaceae bacterium MMS25-I14]
MHYNNDIEEELKRLGSPLAGMSRKMPYHIPEGYFNHLAEELSEGVQAAANDSEPGLFSHISFPMEAPEGYFNYFPQQALMMAREQEILDQLPAADPYAAPERYFEKFPREALAAAKSSDNAFRKRVRLTQVYTRWAAAAIFILFMGLGSYNMLHPQHINVAHTLSRVPADTIDAYVQQNIDEFETEMLENKLADAQTPVQANDKNAVKDLDKQEIIQYLDETGWNEHSEIN